MHEQIGWRGFVRSLADEAPQWAVQLPRLPRLALQALAPDRDRALVEELRRLNHHQRRQGRWLALVAALLAALLAWQILAG